MLSTGSQSLALALDDVSWCWLVAQLCLSGLGSQRLALCAGSQSLALALDDVSWCWLVANRCLSVLGSQRLALCAGSQRCGAMLLNSRSSINTQERLEPRTARYINVWVDRQVITELKKVRGEFLTFLQLR